MSSFIFLQSGMEAITGMLPLLLIFAVFWFFIIRPQMKKQKEQTKFGDSLAKGQEVVTASGMLGRINKIEGEIISLEIAPKTYVRMTKSAVSKELTESIFSSTLGPIEKKD